MSEAKRFGKNIEREMKRETKRNLKQRAHTPELALEMDAELAQLFVDYVAHSAGELDHAFTRWIALDRSVAPLSGPDCPVETGHVLTLSQLEQQEWLRARWEDLKYRCAVVLADAKKLNLEYERCATESQRWQEYAQAAAGTSLPPQVEWVMHRIASRQLRMAGAFQKESQIGYAYADRFREPFSELMKALHASEFDINRLQRRT